MDNQQSLEDLAQENDSIETVEANIEHLELYSEAYPLTLPLRVQTFENEAHFNKFVKNCELLVRRSNEYSSWRNYIIEILGLNTCHITDEHISEVTVEVHHHIPSLFSVVAGVINRKLNSHETFCSFEIAMNVIQLHFENRIGYTILIQSMHEKFHNGCLEIPINLVHGDYNYFIQNYGGYLENDELEKINQRLQVTSTTVNWSRNNYPTAMNE
jgi:hypothetical protein